MDLRRIPGIYGVVSDVSFEHSNVDHVVLTPNGCLPKPGRDGGDDTNTAPVPATTAAKPQTFHDQRIYGWSIGYEELFLEDIPDVLDMVAHAEDYQSARTRP